VGAWNEILVTLAGKAPDLVVFLILVWVFMRSQKNIVSEFVGYMRDKDEEMESVLQENTEALRENTRVIGAAMHALESE
jgi:Na+-transporting methylmalonyl-CoA/oxaloacetate decarboxylase gamma subunit